MKNILVIGSVNMDMVIDTPVLPKLGETLMGSGFMTSGGGKGANGKDIDCAVKFASLASSITVARRGAAVSIPTMDEILAKKDSAWHD